MNLWKSADGVDIIPTHIYRELKPYVESGGTVFVGADSMLIGKRCSFVRVIAMHDPNKKIAKYFYARTKDVTGRYKNLQQKILNEVSLAIETACDVYENFPDADIEVHVDIGSSKKSKTRTMVDQVKGWVISSGFGFKIKPNSWASSTIADWHTK